MIVRLLVDQVETGRHSVTQVGETVAQVVISAVRCSLIQTLVNIRIQFLLVGNGGRLFEHFVQRDSHLVISSLAEIASTLHVLLKAMFLRRILDLLLGTLWTRLDVPHSFTHGPVKLVHFRNLLGNI